MGGGVAGVELMTGGVLMGVLLVADPLRSLS